MNPRVPVTLALSLLFGWSLMTARASSPRDEAHGANQLTIAVADFAGTDKELGRFLAETLLTSLAKSDRLNLVERTEIRQALNEMKLQSTGLFQPQDVKQLGKLVSADRVIVGSYLLREDQMIVNARLLDVKTGRLASGGAANVSGNRNNILDLCRKLAQQFHKRVTGQTLALEGDQDTVPLPEEMPSFEPERPPVEKIEKPAPKVELAALREEWKPLLEKGLVPRTAKMDSLLLEKDLIGVVERAAKLITAQTPRPVTGMQPTAPVTRLRVLTALVRLIVAPDTIALYRNEPPQMTVPDAAQTPAWGMPFVHAALQEGWWQESEPLHARQNATWGFLCRILVHLPFELKTQPDPVPTRLASTGVPALEDEESITGLIVEAYDHRVERTMSPRILDEDGRVVYPDQKRLPDYDFLQDNGMASYHVAAREAKRAGKRPLIVRAIDVVGPVGGDLVVSNRTAERIRAANKRYGFLSRWAVCVLTNSN
jgi:TolB-like protein